MNCFFCLYLPKTKNNVLRKRGNDARNMFIYCFANNLPYFTLFFLNHKASDKVHHQHHCAVDECENNVCKKNIIGVISKLEQIHNPTKNTIEE